MLITEEDYFEKPQTGSIPGIRDPWYFVIPHPPTAHPPYFAMSEDLLPTGQYYIRNVESYAGRHLAEDKSLLPKRVYCPTDRNLELASIACHIMLRYY